MMSPITRRNLTRHELIGLHAEVLKSVHQGYVGISGKIIDETRNTLTLLTQGVRKIIPKGQVFLRLTLPDETVMEIDGKDILARPVERVRRGRRG